MSITSDLLQFTKMLNESQKAITDFGIELQLSKLPLEGKNKIFTSSTFGSLIEYFLNTLETGVILFINDHELFPRLFNTTIQQVFENEAFKEVLEGVDSVTKKPKFEYLNNYYKKLIKY